jgi:hypothetical protein
MGVVAGTALFLTGIVLVQTERYPLLIGTLCISTAILLPSITLSTTLPAIRVEELFYYGFVPLYLLWKQPRLPKRSQQFLRYFGLFLGLAVLSWLFGRFFWGVPTGSRDVVELVKMGKIALIVAFFSSFSYRRIDQKAVLYTLVGAITISGLVGFMGHFGIAGVDRYIAPFYSQAHLGSLDDRLFGTIGNPNSFSVLLIIGIISSALISQIYLRGGKRLYPLLLIGFFVGLITLTGSRTGFALMALAFLLIVGYLAWTYHWGWSALLSSIGLMAGIITLALLLAPEAISTRLFSLTSIGEDLSFQMRLVSWYLNGLIFLDSPIIGWGPAKYLHPTIVDNEYLLMLRRYGLLAFPFYLSLYVHPLYHSWSYVRKHAKSIIQTPLLLLLIGGTVIFLIANLTNTVFMDIQMMDVWAVVLGIGFALMSNNSDHEDTH